MEFSLIYLYLLRTHFLKETLYKMIEFLLKKNTLRSIQTKLLNKLKILIMKKIYFNNYKIFTNIFT